VIEPQGLPAVKLGALLKARGLDRLSDEDMVALQRANLIDPSSPNPVGRDAAACLPAA
jgi:rhamnose utilization protein RhaD (predicted bifunctional aldolase and dehydrogenase)